MNLESTFEAQDRLFAELYPPLMKDAHRALKQAKESPSDYNRRVAFRVAFSAIEGLICILKDHTLAVTPGDGIYSPAELVSLREEDYQLNDRGKASARPRFIRVADNLLFTWNMYFREVLPEFKPDLSTEGWRCFSSSIGVRNRITHPKSGSDLLLNAEDLERLETGFNWAIQTTFRNMAAALLRMRRGHYERLDRVLPEWVKKWLDEAYLQRSQVINSTQDSVRDVQSPDIRVDDLIVSPLTQHGLMQIRNDECWLTADCVLYTKWRAKDGPATSTANC